MFPKSVSGTYTPVQVIRRQRVGNLNTGAAQTKWTKAALEELARLYPDTDNDSLGKHFRRTPKAIATVAVKNGFRKSKAFLSAVYKANRAKQVDVKRSGRPPNRLIPDADQRITVERVPGGRVITHRLMD